MFVRFSNAFLILDGFEVIFLILFSSFAIIPKRKKFFPKRRNETYRSDSSAADEASDNLEEADAKRSSERSRSSSNNWIRRFKAATSDSACKVCASKKEFPGGTNTEERNYNSIRLRELIFIVFMRYSRSITKIWIRCLTLTWPIRFPLQSKEFMCRICLYRQEFLFRVWRADKFTAWWRQISTIFLLPSPLPHQQNTLNRFFASRK